MTRTKRGTRKLEKLVALLADSSSFGEVAGSHKRPTDSIGLMVAYSIVTGAAKLPRMSFEGGDDV